MSKSVDVDFVLKACERAESELGRASNQDITVLVGPTRAGKSTLINYLLEHKLELKKTKNGPEFSTTAGGAKIFHGVESGTSFPVFCGNLGDRQLWDIPGLNDTAGGTNELSNTFYIINLLKRASSAQVFLVIDFPSLNDPNPNAFHKFLNSAVNTFSDLSNFQFYFTKVPKTVPDPNDPDERIDLKDSYISEKIKRIKESVDKVGTNYTTGNQTKVKEFLASVIENKEWKIFSFPTKAEYEALVYKPVSTTTLQSVKGSPSIPKSKLTEVELSISSDIKDALTTKQGEMILQYRTKAEEIVKSVSGEYTTKINSSDLATLKKIHEKLGDGAKSFKEKKHIEALKKLAEGISQTIDTQQLIQLEKSIADIQKLLPAPTTGQTSQETPAKILEKELSREFTTVSKSIQTKENGIHDTNYETAKTAKTNAITQKQKDIDACKDGWWTGVKKFGAGTAGAVGGLVAAPLVGVVGAVEGVKGNKEAGITNYDDSVATKVVKAPVSAVSGVALGLVASAPGFALMAVESVTDNTREKLRKEKAGLQTELDGITKTASSLSLIDFSIDGASSSGTNREVSCILGMEYENEILNYPEVLKVLTDSLAINYSDVLDKVGGFDQEFVREACLSGNVELLEECFGN